MNYFRNNYATLNIYRTLIVIFALIAVASPLATMMILQEEKKVLIMDQGGNYHLVVGRDMRNAKELQMACVKAAAAALLTRTPDGYLYKELLYQSYTKNCEKYLADHLEETKPEFELKKIRQMPEIKKIQLLDQGNGRYLAHVKVYLTRACQYQEVTFVETAEAILSFLLVENPDISANGRLPLAVAQIIRLDVKKIEGPNK